MAVDLPPDEDKPGIVIPQPLLFVLPLLAALLGDKLIPTGFVHGALGWIVGSLLVAAVWL